MLVDVEKGCENVTETAENEHEGWVAVADGVGICYHVGSLERSTSDSEAGTVHRSRCTRCSAWSQSLYWSMDPTPTYREVPGLTAPRPTPYTWRDLFRPLLRLPFRRLKGLHL